jgi:hypothetical protein
MSEQQARFGEKNRKHVLTSEFRSADLLPLTLPPGLDTRGDSSHREFMERKPPIRKPVVKKSVTRKTATARAAPAKRKAAVRTAEKAAADTAAPLRRAIFVDVENTSGESDLLRVLEHLKIDRVAQPTELTAVGNWRAVGARTARLLAGLGAHLVHSAPAIGVRDWSDLWIAVSAGRWLARARPGETLEIVSDDRAFDAVADAAASMGVNFRRTSYRMIPASAERAHATEPTRRRHRRGGRAGRGRAHGPVAAPLAAGPPAAAPPPPPHTEEEAHAASQTQIQAALRRLSGGEPEHWVSLDALANTLKTEGFTRPPGSPRLVVRLRRIKNVEVSPNGLVRLLGERSHGEPSLGHPAPIEPPSQEAGTAVTPPGAAQRQRSRRGGRRRRHRGAPEATGTTEARREAQS